MQSDSEATLSAAAATKMHFQRQRTLSTPRNVLAEPGDALDDTHAFTIVLLFISSISLKQKIKRSADRFFQCGMCIALLSVMVLIQFF